MKQDSAGVEVLGLDSRLDDAFKKLANAGYYAKQDHWCCTNCGCSGVPDEVNNKYVFYHNQDLENLQDTGQCYLCWGKGGDPKEIIAILESCGITAEWNGEEREKIKIELPGGYNGKQCYFNYEEEEKNY